MAPLTFDEIVEALENGEQLQWHPDYGFQGWKDGQGPLTIVHASFLMEVEDKKTKNKQKHYFVGYRCSKEGCRNCESKQENLVGPHHILMKRNGYALTPRMEWFEYKKRTETKEHKNPVFVKYEKIRQTHQGR